MTEHVFAQACGSFCSSPIAETRHLEYPHADRVEEWAIHPFQGAGTTGLLISAVYTPRFQKKKNTKFINDLPYMRKKVGNYG